MMKEELKIGELRFKYKKDALSHFRKILNSYENGQALNQEDFEQVFSLLKLHRNATEKIGCGVKSLKVDSVRHNTKCFKIFRVDSTSDIFSYTKCVNGGSTPIAKFNKVCRETINDDLREVKLAYFKKYSSKGRVKCQETGDLCSWEELSVDHRQPNTLSIIIDRFIELIGVDVSLVDYKKTPDHVYIFKDDSLTERFRHYHKEKANLRIVKKIINLSRSHQARVKRQKRDLTIE